MYLDCGGYAIEHVAAEVDRHPESDAHAADWEDGGTDVFLTCGDGSASGERPWTVALWHDETGSVYPNG